MILLLMMLKAKGQKRAKRVPKLCFIGLGNPGSKYDNTRHNIGKDWLLKISERHCDGFINKKKLEADISFSHSEEILWVIPDNYVNKFERHHTK